MSPDPHPRRPTIIPEAFPGDHEHDRVHRAKTMIEGYQPPSPIAPVPASPEAPEPARGAEEGVTERRNTAPPGFLGMGFVADVVFFVVLSLVFAAGLGIGAALVAP